MSVQRAFECGCISNCFELLSSIVHILHTLILERGLLFWSLIVAHFSIQPDRLAKNAIIPNEVSKVPRAAAVIRLGAWLDTQRPVL